MARTEWESEKALQLSTARPVDLVGGRLPYPIHHRKEAKVRQQKRSFRSDQAWHEKQIARNDATERRRREAQRRAANKKSKEEAAHKKAKLTASTPVTAVKETPAERRAREERERIEEEQVTQYTPYTLMAIKHAWMF